MSLRCICIEVRKNIRCANVFLQFDNSLTSTELLQISVDETALRLCESSTEIYAALDEYFIIEAKTISNLMVKGCNASFRIGINNIAEDKRIADQIPESETINCCPKLTHNEPTTLHCKNCKCSLTAAQTFVRIREFPSGSIDMGEFFCHHGPDLSATLVPQFTDLFYGFQFVVLKRELLLQSATREKERHLYCRRCLQYLGEELLAGKAYKLWSDALCLQTAGSVNFHSIFGSDTLTNCQLLQKIIRDTTIDITAVPLLLRQLQFTKVLLQAAFPNRQSKYLLLHILEKELPVLRNVKPLTQFSNNNNNNVVHVQLQRFYCFKLLYLLIDESAAKLRECNALLDNWQKDLSIHFLKISPTLFSALLHELLNNSKLLLDTGEPNDFQQSYVFY